MASHRYYMVALAGLSSAKHGQPFHFQKTGPADP